MGKIVGFCIALLLLAVGFVVLSEGREATALLDWFHSLPWLLQAAWAIILFVCFALLLCAGWLSFTLMRQRKTTKVLEQRLDGVRDGVKTLVKMQVDAEADVHQLARTDPEDAMAAIQQRLTEAERFAQVQQSRNEAVDLQSRVDFVRGQQQVLKERLAPMLERRRSIDLLFLELDGHQNDIDRTVKEIVNGDDAVALELGLGKMIDFVKRSHERCDELERAAKAAAGLKEDYADLRNRLLPFASANDGLAIRVRQLREANDGLAAELDSLEQTPEGPLTERLNKFGKDKKVLESRVAQLNEEFSRFAALRKDASNLFANFNRVLDTVALNGTDHGDVDGTALGTAAVDARTEELAKFIVTTQANLDGIERRMDVFGQLKAKLGEVQSRLVPLESEEDGVVSLSGQLGEMRDKLAARIRRMEESEDGDLAERVRDFTESKKELEQRVSLINEHFLKLATIRKDIAGLFDKLSITVSTPAN